jgi:hypothetical protein
MFRSPPSSARRGFRRGIVSLALATALSASVARAQPRRQRGDAAAEARWRTLLQQAFAQSNQSHHADAVRLAEEAGSIRMTPGVRLFLAEEHEFLSRVPSGVGHLVDAERLSVACLEEANAQRSLDDRQRILRDCTVVRDRVRARMVRLTVEVPTPPPETAVQVNGEPLPATAFGVEMRRAPGVFVIEATAPRHGHFHHTVTLTEGAVARVTAVIPEPVAPADGTTFAAIAPSAGSPLEPGPASGGSNAAPSASPRRAVRIAGLGVLAAGAVAAIVAVWQAGVTASQRELTQTASRASFDPDAMAWFAYQNTVNRRRALSADAVCERSSADAAGSADAARVQGLCDANASAQTLALTFGIGAAALIGAGVTLLLVSSNPRSRAAMVSVTPTIGANLGGVLIGGRF